MLFVERGDFCGWVMVHYKWGRLGQELFGVEVLGLVGFLIGRCYYQPSWF